MLCLLLVWLAGAPPARDSPQPPAPPSLPLWFLQSPASLLVSARGLFQHRPTTGAKRRRENQTKKKAKSKRHKKNNEGGGSHTERQRQDHTHTHTQPDRHKQTDTRTQTQTHTDTDTHTHTTTCALAKTTMMSHLHARRLFVQGNHLLSDLRQLVRVRWDLRHLFGERGKRKRVCAHLCLGPSAVLHAIVTHAHH